MKTNQLHTFLILFTILSTVMCSVNAQDFIKGTVLEKGTTIRIALATVTNKRTNESVGTNDMGYFQLVAKTGDTLIFSKTNFIQEKFKVADKKDVIARLTRMNINLDEVTIMATNKKQNLTEAKLEHRNKTYFYNHKRSIFQYLKSPISVIRELLSPERKNARRFNKHYAREFDEMEIDQFFNTALVKGNTTLNGKNLEQFLLNYRPTLEQTSKWNNYDAITYIKRSAKHYLDTLKQVP